MSGSGKVRPLPRARRKAFAALASRAGRERSGRFLLEGPRAIADALARGVAFEALVVDDAGAARLQEWGADGRLPPGLETYRTAERELAALADTASPQGMLAIGRRPAARVADLPPPAGRVVLLADGVQDPGNLGTLLRTLAAAGGTIAICLRGTVDPWNPKALRGAAGATFSLAIAAGVDPSEALEWCAGHGIPVVALSADAPSLFERSTPAGRIALAVGNEAAGLSPDVLRVAAAVASLPMAPGVESLSAAVAGSVAMYVLAHGLVPAEGAPA